MKLGMMMGLCAAAWSVVAAENCPLEEKLAPAEGMSVFGLSLLPARYLEFPGPDSDVKGLRFNVFGGSHRDVGGLDFGTFVNMADGDLDGLSVAGVGTWCSGSSFGVHLSSVINYAESEVNGMQLAIVNSAWGVNGLQIGVVNATSDGHGVQLGVCNLAESFSGFQLGVVNMAMHYSGIQLGLGNIIADSPLTACVVLNAWF